MTLAFESAVSLSRRLATKEISARELTDYFIRRIERFDGVLNAVVVRDFERAREAADAADAARAAGRDLGPLHGLPMTIKESYDVAGLPTHWGVPACKDNVAATDSVVVQRFKAAGAHVLGKTNVPVMLADFQSYNDLHGTTGNPWDPARTPGGSSGGSAAALAAGLTGLDSGSDIGGSIRNPAHFCGVYGHKPTYGVVPMQGHALPGMVAPPDIAVVGPMARSAADLALAMDVVAGAGPMASAGWKLALPRPAKSSLAEYRVALWPSDAQAPVATEIADRVQGVGDLLAGLGATVSDRARPDIDVELARRTYTYMLNGALCGGIPDAEFAAIAEQAAAFAPDDVSPAAVFARSQVQTHRDWLGHADERERLRLAWQAFFRDWDLLICPQMASTAFRHDHSPFEGRRIPVDGAEQPYFQQVFWAGLVTVAYLPSTVFPTGPGADGLPIGLQAVSGEFNDYLCIDFARQLEQARGGFEAPPGYAD
jgi:amidase